MLDKILTAAAIVAWGSVAQAAVLQAVYTGKVENSFDQFLSFGTTETNGLDGLDFSLTYVYDPSVGTPFSTSAVLAVFGGTAPPNLVPSPIISASLKINGVTRSVNGSYFGSVVVQQTDSGFNSIDGVQHYAQDFGSTPDRTFDFIISTNVYDFDLPVPLSLTTPFGFNVPDGAPLNSGSFLFQDVVAGVAIENSSGILRFRSLTVSEVTDLPPTPAPIPLPASFPLLLAGMAGLVGWKARARRRAV